MASTTTLEGLWLGELLPATNPVRIPFVFSFLDHPVTDEAVAAMGQYDETRTPSVECIDFPTPMILALTAIYVSEIEIDNDVMTFTNEFYDAKRTVYLDGRGHPENGERTVQGHSIGTWEGDTLVVDTRLFAEHSSPYGVGIPSGAQKHVVERFTLSDEGTQLLVDVFLEDPQYLAEPFMGSLAFNYSPHLERLSVDCDPNVARRFVE